MKKYPDMKELFARKEARRRKLASLPITEKMAIAQQLQETGRNAPGLRTKPKARKTKWSLTTLRPKKQKVA